MSIFPFVRSICTSHTEKSTDPVAKAEAVGYARELDIAVAGLKEMHKRGIKVSRSNS